MHEELGFCLRQDERGDWLYCEDGEERYATLSERVLWGALVAARKAEPAGEVYAGDHAPLPEDVPYPPSLDNVTIYDAYGPMSFDPIDGQPVESYWDRYGLRDYGARCISWATQSAPAAEPLTDASIDSLVLNTTGYDGKGTQPMNAHDTRGIARATERACAEKWGVKLGASGGEVQHG